MMNLLLSSEAEAAGQAMASPIVWVIYFAVLIGIFYEADQSGSPAAILSSFDFLYAANSPRSRESRISVIMVL